MVRQRFAKPSVTQKGVQVQVLSASPPRASRQRESLFDSLSVISITVLIHDTSIFLFPLFTSYILCQPLIQTKRIQNRFSYCMGVWPIPCSIICRCGGTGRHIRFKLGCLWRRGSTPLSGTSRIRAIWQFGSKSA